MADAKVNYVELVEQISEDFDATSDDMVWNEQVTFLDLSLNSKSSLSDF